MTESGERGVGNGEIYSEFAAVAFPQRRKDAEKTQRNASHGYKRGDICVHLCLSVADMYFEL